jgi:hypothetical protein
MTLHEELGLGKSKLVSKETKVRMGVQAVSAQSAYTTSGKSLAVLQVNCRSIYNKARILEFSGHVQSRYCHRHEVMGERLVARTLLT